MLLYRLYIYSMVLCVFVSAAPVLAATGMATDAAQKAAIAYANKDYISARDFWLMLAEKGDSAAMYNLGVLYEKGEGMPQSYRDAAGWFSRAAAGNNADAQARLGHFYRTGKGVTKQRDRATLLLYGATLEGHHSAMQELFSMAEEEYKGKGLPSVNLFGVALNSSQGVTRTYMRAALAKSGIPIKRQDDTFICDVYAVEKHIPGATQMALCYSPGAEEQQQLGFMKIDYTAKDKAHADAVQNMVAARFGPQWAVEKDTGALWNLGHVLVATQFVPDVAQVGLMYMLPKAYHMTQNATKAKKTP